MTMCHQEILCRTDLVLLMSFLFPRKRIRRRFNTVRRLFICREYDVRTGLTVLLDPVQKIIQLHGTFKQYLQKSKIVAGNAVTFYHVLAVLNKGVKFLFIRRFYGYADKGCYHKSYGTCIQIQAVAPDDPVLFQLFNPGPDSRGRDPEIGRAHV